VAGGEKGQLAGDNVTGQQSEVSYSHLQLSSLQTKEHNC